MCRPRVVAQSRSRRSAVPVEYPRTRERALSIERRTSGGRGAGEMDHLGRRTLVPRNDDGGSVGPRWGCSPVMRECVGSQDVRGPRLRGVPTPSTIAVPGWRGQEMSSVSDLARRSGMTSGRGAPSLGENPDRHARFVRPSRSLTRGDQEGHKLAPSGLFCWMTFPLVRGLGTGCRSVLASSRRRLDDGGASVPPLPR